MMDFESKLTGKVHAVYSSIEKTLEVEKNKIETDLIPKIKEQFNEEIKKENSFVTTDEPYNLEYIIRKKSEKSISEKLIRKDIISINSKPEDIEREITPDFITKKLDDLIGVTLVTQNSSQNKKLLSIVIDKVKKSDDYTIIDTNHPDQIPDKETIQSWKPAKVGNLAYYKLKIRNEQKQTFELQIKSEIIKAYANIDHTLLYKQNVPVPNRTQAEILMKNTSVLLDVAEKNIVQISELLNKDTDTKYTVDSCINLFLEDNFKTSINYNSSYKELLSPIKYKLISPNFLVNPDKEKIDTELKKYVSGDFSVGNLDIKTNVQTIFFSIFKNIKQLFVKSMVNILKSKDVDVPTLFEDFDKLTLYEDFFPYFLGNDIKKDDQKKIIFYIVKHYFFDSANEQQDLTNIINESINHKKDDDILLSDVAEEHPLENFLDLNLTDNEKENSDNKLRQECQTILKNKIEAKIGEEAND